MFLGRGASNTDLACNQRCVNLDLDAKLKPRVRNYYWFWPSNGSQAFVIPPSAWPTYILGYCGSNVTNVDSELGVVRHVGLYAFPLSTSSVCGNFMLNAGKPSPR